LKSADNPATPKPKNNNPKKISQIPSWKVDLHAFFSKSFKFIFSEIF